MVIRGVPERLAQDAWWLDDPIPAGAKRDWGYQAGGPRPNLPQKGSDQ
ncbi:hypothetical protein [Yoonia sp. BS5-3]|uniref:Uncharacterized protein n=1 Tax=Yoonia phaeophyticola TaxID=3137369 RepID=A0ABZ2VAX5_9RHOB